MILLIDNYDSFTYNLYQALSSFSMEVTVVRNDAISIEEIERLNVEGIVLSPGPGGPEEAGICIEVIQALGNRVPILGICLGHQAIGKAFGAKIERAQEVLHGKESLIFHHRKDLFLRLPLPFAAGRYHSLVVSPDEFPSCLNIDAEDAKGTIMALSHQTFPIFGLQFHPESILTPEGKTLLKNFVQLCLELQKHPKEAPVC